VRFSSNLLGDSWNLEEVLATDDLVANPSPRTGDSVANHARRFYDSLINIYTLSSVSRRTANQKSTKIGELLTKNLQKMENRRLSCQSFSEILRILEIVWPELRQNVNSYLKSKEHH
jgi:hypothetical protein